MEKKLGGSERGKSGGAPGSDDEFNVSKLEVNETLNFIKKKQDERDQKVAKFGSSPDSLRMGAEIRDKIAELEKQIEKMNQALRKQRKNQKKYSKSELENKEKQYNNFVNLMKEVKTREQGGPNTQPKEDVKTLLEMKSALMAGGKRGPGERAPDRDLTEEERVALDKFKEVDKQQDVIIDQINQGLESLKGKAVGIGENVDRQTDLILNLDKEVDDTYSQLQSSNAKLKRVLDEYRKPSKFCVDVVLILILLGLIGILLKMMGLYS